MRRDSSIFSLDGLRSVANQTHTVIVKLLRTSPWVGDDDQGPFAGTHIAELDGADAERLLRHVRGLKPAKRKRCYDPRYSLTLVRPGHRDVEIAFSFDCNTATVRDGDVRDSLAFDGRAQSGAELLRIMGELDPENEEAQWFSEQ